MDKVKIIVEDEEGNIKQNIEYECDQWEVSTEQGHTHIYNGLEPTIESNGQGRMQLKAWKGCHSFDTFVSKEEEVLANGEVISRRIITEDSDK